MFRMFKQVKCAWTDFSFWAIFQNPEIHPEAKTLKDFHEDMAELVNRVRLTIPDADTDTSFKQIANIVAQLLPIGIQLESVEVMESGRLESQRIKLMYQLGGERDCFPKVTGEASKLFAQGYAAMFQDMLGKKYWPSKDCKTMALNQSYLATYVKDFNSWLTKWLEDAVKEINTRVENYDKGLDVAVETEKRLAM